jgi:DNA helicase-2/ATP-dependent DNA helicase PcrA
MVNPSDQLHLNMIIKRWKPDCKIVFNDIPDPANILLYFKNIACNEDQVAIINALRSSNYTGHNFDFTKALDYLYNYSLKKENLEETALIQEDILVWRKHWDLFLRSQPGGQHSLSTFLSQVALGTTQQPRQEGIALLTVHSAKGLEFDVVVIMGMTEGSFPDYRAKGPALQEERRNMFVAVTRCKRVLGLSYPRTRVMPWGNTRRQQPSRYLRDLGLLTTSE